MDILKLIKSHKELEELPLLVVYQTISVLRKMGMMYSGQEREDGVE